MTIVRRFIKSLIPPILLHRQVAIPAAPKQEMWSGDYASWAEATSNTTGYDSGIILEKCKTALLKVKRGEAVYERDSFLFDKIHHNWGLLAALERAALENHGSLCVVDFGGSLGSTYFPNKVFLPALKDLKWCVVEQPHFVECGKENFESEELKFYYSVEECMASHKPDVLLLSGVLQYLEKPYEWIEKFVLHRIPYIIVDRAGIGESERDILTIQTVPETIYKASYACWFFNKKRLLQAFEKSYTTLAEFDSGFTPPGTINGSVPVYWSGLILKRR